MRVKKPISPHFILQETNRTHSDDSGGGGWLCCNPADVVLLPRGHLLHR